MTTDKFPKYLTKAYDINNKRIIFKGICKGAGMIEPNMATMLSFIETNAIYPNRFLRSILNNAQIYLLILFLLMETCQQMTQLFF